MTVALRHLAALAVRQVFGTPLRSILTVVAVAAGVSLIAAVLSLGSALDRSLAADNGGRHLLVMQAYRYCPLTSWLPEQRRDAIAAVPGVTAVRPLRILPSHCGTALDVLVVRGVPPDNPADDLRVVSGDLGAWDGEGALVGLATARRRGLQVGDRFEAAGFEFTVSAITDGAHPADREQVRVHLATLQRIAPGQGADLVTAFQVAVAMDHDPQEVALAIDEQLASHGVASQTRSERAAMAAAARDLITLAQATQVLALAAALAVAALVANALILGLRARRRTMAILAAIGYGSRERALLVLMEGSMLAAAGALIGVAITGGWLWLAPPGVASEGWTLDLRVDHTLWQAWLASCALGLAAAALPAWNAARCNLPLLLRTGAAT